MPGDSFFTRWLVRKADSKTPQPGAEEEQKKSAFPRIAWGVILLMVVGLMLVSTGGGLSAVTLVIAGVSLLFAWNFPYITFYAALATAPLLGWIVSISTGTLSFGDRAFGGAIDIGVGELVATLAITVWALRILVLWKGRNDRHWQPWLPLLLPYLVLVGAHILSLFSFAEPDPLLVIKYSLRPVFLAWLFYVAMPVNFIHSKKRLLTALAVLTVVGTFFAADGFRSLLTFGNGEIVNLHRARPLPILGVSPIGENHNVLAEFLLFTAPVALAASLLTRKKEHKNAFQVVASFMAGIALLTFARSAWISFIFQMGLLSATIWREWIKTNRRILTYIALAFLPLAIYMLLFSSTAEVQSSTDARAMMTEIGWETFKSSPIFGIGAGQWVDRISRTWIFTFEFGTPMDSHGVIQKIGAETGLLGLSAFALVWAVIFVWIKRTARVLKHHVEEHQAFMILAFATFGALVYQLFNTTYWTAKLWLPVGIVFAAGKVLRDRVQTRDPDFLRSLDS